MRGAIMNGIREILDTLHISQFCKQFRIDCVKCEILPRRQSNLSLSQFSVTLSSHEREKGEKVTFGVIDRCPKNRRHELCINIWRWWFGRLKNEQAMNCDLRRHLTRNPRILFHGKNFLAHLRNCCSFYSVRSERGGFLWTGLSGVCLFLPLNLNSLRHNFSHILPYRLFLRLVTVREKSVTEESPVCLLRNWNSEPEKTIDIFGFASLSETTLRKSLFACFFFAKLSDSKRHSGRQAIKSLSNWTVG